MSSCRTVFVCAAIMTGMLAALAAQAQPDSAPASQASRSPIELHITSQPLVDALTEFARQAGLQLLLDADEAAQGVSAPAISGSYTPEDALRVLLANASLRYEFLDSRTVAIRGPKSKSSAGARSNANARVIGGEDMRLAQSAGTNDAAADGARSTEANDKDASRNIDEVIVSAQKRAERLQDVPVPVTAVSGESLINSNQLRLQDYYTKVPGLNFNPGGLNGEPQLTIRGLTTGGFTNPVVGVLVDDVPYGASTGKAIGNVAPDFDPSDLERIEVLRGPQGSLYGASSMGGLIKFVTADPTLGTFKGRVQLGMNSVHDAEDPGYSARGTVNIPLGSTVALRASGFTRRDAGYIDDPVHDRKDVNQVDVQGGRAALLWRPSDAFSLRLSAIVQTTDADGPGAAETGTGLGDLENNVAPRTGWYKRDFAAYSATMTAELGKVSLTSVTGYNVDEVVDAVDFGLTLTDRFHTDKLTQEIRMSMPLSNTVDWMLGAFYMREDTNPREQGLWVPDPTTGELVSFLLLDHNPSGIKEYAGFTNFTWQATERFDLQVGGRVSSIDQYDYASTIFPGNVSTVNPRVQATTHSFTFLVTPRWKISDDVMAYARFASGYRPGGPNPSTSIVIAGGPNAYDPDTTENYELGIKGESFDGILSFDASVYYIDWKDVQLSFTRNNFTYFGNAGKAKSQGAELSAELRPSPASLISAWVAWTDAKLTEGLPAGSQFALTGERLPSSAKFSGSISVDQEFALTSRMNAFVGGSFSYIGDRLGNFRGSVGAPRPVYPSYTKLDLLGGVRWDTWTASLYVNNVADKRGTLSGDPSFDNSFYYIQPRTIGMSVAKSF